MNMSFPSPDVRMEVGDKIQLLSDALAGGGGDMNEKKRLYLELFEVLSTESSSERDEALLEKLESLRLEYSDLFLPDETFWRTWLHDSIQRRVDFDHVLSVFNKALNACPDIRVLGPFFEYAIDNVEEEIISSEKLRSIFESSIQACGIDIITGHLFWKIYRDFECEECEDQLDNAASKASIQEAKERVIRLFHRQLSLPLHDNETALTEFDEILARICVESDLKLIDPQSLQTKYLNGLQLREARMGFEHALLSEEYRYVSQETQYASYWRPYIDFEIKSSEMSRAQRLFERVLMDCKDVLVCWEDFISFACTDLKNWSLVESIGSRAVKVFRNESTFWMTCLKSIEVNAKPHELVSKTLHQALQNMFARADDYLDLLIFSCDFHRRQVLSMKSRDKVPHPDELTMAIERLRASFDAAEAFLEVYYPSWTEGWMRVFRYHSQVEEELVAEVADLLPSSLQKRYSSQADKIWEKALKKLSKSMYAWLECIAWARSNGNISFCRALFRKSLAALAEPKEMCLQWIAFERQVGTLNDLLEAENRCRSHLKSDSGSTVSSLMNGDQSHVSTAPVPSLTTTSSDHPRIDKRKSEQSSSSSSSSAALASSSKQADIKKPKMIEKASKAPLSTKKDKKYSVFVKNLSFECNTEMISAHFGEVSGLLGVNLITTQTGKFRGMATIDFDSQEGRDAALALHGSMLSGRPITVEVVRKEEADHGTGNAHPTTVFVSKLTRETTEQDLRDFFAHCGEIEAIRLLVDKFSGNSKVFCDHTNPRTVHFVFECNFT